MTELELKYGCNPSQSPARIFAREGKLPITVLNGKPGYINLLDALGGWQLVRELKAALNLPAAASFKHVSPAGAAVGLPLSDSLRRGYFIGEDTLSPLACAFARARGADRMSSYGDFISLSDVCDLSTARLIEKEASDGIVAPGYDADALEVLKAKRKGAYLVMKIDPDYVPPALERKDVFGITFEQGRSDSLIGRDLLRHVVTAEKTLPEEAVRDLLVALITLKYTQSNSVCYARDGQAIGVGAGQQSRIHCTRLAGDKADLWWLRQHPKVLDYAFPAGMKRFERDTLLDRLLLEDALLSAAEKKEWLAGLSGVSLGSDAFFPFEDNIERAVRSGVRYIAQPGGALRDDAVTAACDKEGIVMAFTGVRLFLH